MSHTIRPHDVLLAIKSHPWRLALPVIVCTLLALGYALVRPTSWEASQAIVVRDEAGDRLARPGRFAQADEMKTSQETILELARSRGVLYDALAQVGPPADYADPAAWPTDTDVESLQASVKVTPPKGAEFGKTEVFYLKAQSTDRQRALALVKALGEQLQNRFGELRETKARSTIDELTKAVSLAKADLDKATSELAKLEQRVGSDLAELRMLNDLPSGDSDLRRTAIELEKELRSYQSAQLENEESLKLLKEAQVNPARLLATPSTLLKSQPALARLRDGLVDAQLRSGQALGTMSEEHPLAKGARAAEQAIRDQLNEEIAVAIRGVEAEYRVNADRVNSLQKQSTAIQDRLSRLASVRAEYSNLVSATKNRAETLKAVEHDLAEARASQAAARSASLISLIGKPDTGNRPVGPGRTTIVAAGFGGGLLIACSILFLSIAPAPIKPAAVHVEESAPLVELAAPRAKEPARRAEEPEVRSLPFEAAAKGPGGKLTVKQALQRVAGNQI